MALSTLDIDLILKSAKFNEGLKGAKAQLTDFEKSAMKTSRELNKFGKSLESVGGSLSKNLTLPIIAAGAAIGVAIAKTAKYGDEINNMAVRTGISRGELQELKFAAGQVGVEFGSLVTGSKNITKAMGDAAMGSGNAANLFKQLGVSTTDANGELRKSSEVMNDTIAALHNVENETTRNIIGQQLFGKSYTELIPLIDAGGAGLSKYAAEARAAGLVMSDEAIIAADGFGDKMDKLKLQIEFASMQIASAFMPIVEKMASFITATIVPALKKFAEWFKNLSDTQQKVVIGFTGLAAAAGPALMMFGSMARGAAALLPLLAGLSLPVLAIAAAVAAAAALIIYNWDSIVEFFEGDGKEVFDELKNAVSEAMNAISELWKQGVDLVKAIWDKWGGTIIKIAKDALKFVMDIVSNVLGGISDIFFIFTSLLQGNWSAVWDGIKSVLTRVLQIIISIIARTIDVFLMIVQGAVGIFSDEWASGISSARKSLTGFKDGIIETTDAWKRQTPEVEKTTSATDLFTATADEAAKKLDGKLNPSLGNTGKEVEKLTELFAKWKDEMMNASIISDALGGTALELLNQKLSITKSSMEALAKAGKSTSLAFLSLEGQAMHLQTEIDKLKLAAKITEAEDAVKGMGAAFKDAKDEATDFGLKTISVSDEAKIKYDIAIATLKLMKSAGIDPLSPAFIKVKDDAKEAAEGISTDFKTATEKIAEAIQKVAAIVSQIGGQIMAIWAQGIANQMTALDNRYAHEKELIEGSGLSEEKKAARMAALDKDVAEKRKALMLKKAKQDKAAAIFSATIAVAVAVASTLANPVLAAIVAALGAVQIGLIAAAPLPMAKGGLVFGETLATVGEGRGTTASNPEVVAPLDQLMNFMQPEGGAGGQVEFIIAGETLRGVLDRNAKARKYLSR